MALTLLASDETLMLECDNAFELTRICNALGVSQEGLVTVRVTFIRDPLTQIDRRYKLQYHPGDDHAAGAKQLELEV